MEQNEALYRALGSIEGKMDLLLAHTAANQQTTNARLDQHSERLSSLETWKGKATASITVVLTIMSGVWSAIIFLFK